MASGAAVASIGVRMAASEWLDAREQRVQEWTGITPAQTRILRTLAEALAAGEVDLDAVVQRTAEAVAEHYDAGVFIALVEDGRALRARGAHHPQPHARREALKLRKVELDAERGFFVRLAETGLPLVLPDVPTEEVLLRRPELTCYAAVAGIRSGILVPLRARGRVLGVLALVRARPMERIVAADQGFLEEVADRLALGIDAWRLAAELDRRAGAPAGTGGEEELTARELETLDLIARGLTSREIGERLHLSVRTIEWYRERIQLKLGVSGRAALVEQARRRGLGGWPSVP